MARGARRRFHKPDRTRIEARIDAIPARLGSTQPSPAPLPTAAAGFFGVKADAQTAADVLTAIAPLIKDKEVQIFTLDKATAETLQKYQQK